MTCMTKRQAREAITTETTRRVLAINATTTVTMTIVTCTSPEFKLKMMTKASRPKRADDTLSTCATEKGLWFIAC